VLAAQVDPAWVPFVEGMRGIYFGVPADAAAVIGVEPLDTALVGAVVALGGALLVAQAVVAVRGGWTLRGAWRGLARRFGLRSASMRGGSSRQLATLNVSNSFDKAPKPQPDAGGPADEPQPHEPPYDEPGSDAAQQPPSPSRSRAGGVALAAELRALTETHEASVVAMRSSLASLEAQLLAGGACGVPPVGLKARKQQRALARVTSRLAGQDGSAQRLNGSGGGGDDEADEGGTPRSPEAGEPRMDARLDV
jgi:hypothetical protein